MNYRIYKYYPYELGSATLADINLTNPTILSVTNDGICLITFKIC